MARILPALSEPVKVAHATNYLLTTTNNVAITNYSVTIPAGQTNLLLRVLPFDDRVNEFDESAVVVLTSSDYLVVDPANRHAEVIIENNPRQDFFELVLATGDTNYPVGLDYHPVSNGLVMSIEYSANNTNANRLKNFLFLTTNGSGQLVTNAWSGITNLSAEVKLAIVQKTTNGFTAGEMFFGTGTNGVVAKLSNNAAGSNLSWATLNSTTNPSTLLRGSLYVDQTGVFSNDLIVVTGGTDPTPGGEVWRISADGSGNFASAYLLAELTNSIFRHLEGVITLPDDPLRYGPWAGKIITGAESEEPPRIYTIATNGLVTTNYFGMRAEDFDLVATNQDLYCAVTTSPAGLYKISKTWFTNYVGDLLITQEEALFGSSGQPGMLYLLRWDSTNSLFFRTEIPYSDSTSLIRNFEHATFAPLNFPVQ